jgi:acyl-CoA hydrolase
VHNARKKKYICKKKEMNLEDLKEKAITKQLKCVFKNCLNHHNTMFGGQALKWMDEVAFITASRFCKKKMVTISTGKISFSKPIPEGSYIEIIGKVGRVGLVKLEIQIEVFLEEEYGDQRQKAISGSFFFAAIDENNRPQKLAAS